MKELTYYDGKVEEKDNRPLQTIPSKTVLIYRSQFGTYFTRNNEKWNWISKRELPKHIQLAFTLMDK